MAEIDPSIALQYRPPNLATLPNLQVQTPLESLARVVSLRSMMQEGALKGLQLQQLQQQITEQKNLSDLMRSMYGDTTPTGTPAAPLTAAPAQTIIPGNLPGQAALTAPAPAAPTPSGTIAGVPQGAFWMPQPQPQQALTAPAVAPAPQPATVSAGQLMAPQPQATASGIPGWPAQYPTPAQIMRAAPITGPALIQKLTDQQKDVLDLYIKNQTMQKNRTEDMVRLANGAQDPESFQRNVVEAANSGYISSDEARRRIAAGFDDPGTKAWLHSVQMSAVTADKQQQMKIDLARNAREEAMFGPDYAKKVADQQAAEFQDAATKASDLKDDSQLPGFLASLGPYAANRYAYLLNSNIPIEQKKRAIMMGAGGEQKVTEAAATAGATKRAGYEEQVREDEPVIQAVVNGTQQFQELPGPTQERILPEVQRRIAAQQQPGGGQAAPEAGAPTGAPGEAPPGAAPTRTPFQGFGKQISDDERQRLTDLDNSISLVEKLKTDINDPYNRTFMGPPSAALRYVPGVGTNIQKMQADYGLVKQKLKGFVTNKSLRGLTPEGLDDIMPSVSSPPSVNDYKVQNLLTQLKAEREQYVKNLAGKVVPPGMTPPTPAPTAAPATAPPKGAPSVRMRAPNGFEKDIPADQVDFYKKKGATVIQ